MLSLTVFIFIMHSYISFILINSRMALFCGQNCPRVYSSYESILLNPVAIKLMVSGLLTLYVM